MPWELMVYIYRREFHLSAAEMEAEPVDQFFTNLNILRMIRDKERREAEHA